MIAEPTEGGILSVLQTLSASVDTGGMQDKGVLPSAVQVVQVANNSQEDPKTDKEAMQEKIRLCLTDHRFLPLPPQRRKLIFALPRASSDYLDLRACIVDILRCSTLGPAALDRFGDDRERCLTNLHCVEGSDRGHKGAHSPFRKVYKTVISSPTHKATTPGEVALRLRFKHILSELARNVLAPLLGVGPDDVLYQAKPVFRVSHPKDVAGCKMHTDYGSNNHQPAEVNFWIPLNSVFGSNTLYVESEPNKGDFSPVELEYGQGLMFWGNQCRHYSVANVTNTTRVSLDMRAIARSRFNAAFVDRRGKPNARRIGEFYADSGSGSGQSVMEKKEASAAHNNNNNK
jgi:hypothetical protein